MKNFLVKYYKEILLVVLTLLLTIILIKIFKPIEDRSELLKYKEEINNNFVLLRFENQNDRNQEDFYFEIFKDVDINIKNIKVLYFYKFYITDNLKLFKNGKQKRFY
jgi:hypothetical protein